MEDGTTTAEPAATRALVYTVGYGGRTTEDVLEQLSQTKVQFVIDVRSVPYSRYQPDFAQRQLKDLLRKKRIRYVFMGDTLGGRPPDDDCYTDGHVDYAKTRAKPLFGRGIARVIDAHSQGLTVCLLCSEGAPWRCHRSKLIGTTLDDKGIVVRHLLANGKTSSQEEVIRKVTGGQSNLFGAHLLSRNSYR